VSDSWGSEWPWDWDGLPREPAAGRHRNAGTVEPAVDVVPVRPRPAPRGRPVTTASARATTKRATTQRGTTQRGTTPRSTTQRTPTQRTTTPQPGSRTRAAHARPDARRRHRGPSARVRRRRAALAGMIFIALACTAAVWGTGHGPVAAAHGSLLPGASLGAGQTPARGVTPARASGRADASRTAPVSTTPKPAGAPAALALAGGCAGRTAPKLLMVDISRQVMWACHRDTEVFATRVTTGAYQVGQATPTGTWRILAKQTDTHLIGPGWDDFVHYWMPFWGAYGFHDATWQTFPFGSARYAEDGSHGCVHVPLKVMRRLFSWTTVGTEVQVEA